jgi:hypothetical protein
MLASIIVSRDKARPRFGNFEVIRSISLCRRIPTEYSVSALTALPWGPQDVAMAVAKVAGILKRENPATAIPDDFVPARPALQQHSRICRTVAYGHNVLSAPHTSLDAEHRHKACAKACKSRTSTFPSRAGSEPNERGAPSFSAHHRIGRRAHFADIAISARQARCTQNARGIGGYFAPCAPITAGSVAIRIYRSSQKERFWI